MTALRHAVLVLALLFSACIGDGKSPLECEPEDIVDADKDGYPSPESTCFVLLQDCDDEDDTVHPFAVESCEDDVDNDCDRSTNEDCPPPTT